MKGLIYTAIYGGYDSLRQPCEKLDGWDYICVSDQKFDGGAWDVVKFGMKYDSVRCSRFVKILMNPIILGYDIGIWVDGSIEIIGDINSFLKEIPSGDLVIPRHPNHKTLKRELEACIALKKDDPDIMTRQVEGYGDFPPYEHVQTNIMVKNADIDISMKAWWDEVRDKSYRDQLSFGWAMYRTNQTYSTFDRDLTKKYFTWHKFHK